MKTNNTLVNLLPELARDLQTVLNADDTNMMRIFRELIDIDGYHSEIWNEYTLTA